MTDDFAAQVSGIGALADPVRRVLYLYVVRQAEPVSRDQAAAAAGLSRHAAKFHLDRLVREGLLETEYRRLSGRRGPGAGRPSKLYRRANRQVAVSLPDRDYELAARILADALDDADARGTPVSEAVATAAARAGRELARGPSVATPVPTGSRSPLDAVAEVLSRCGYEPRHCEDDRLILANCPFHALARRNTQLVCGMNLGLITALVGELGYGDIDVRLDPAPARCCVSMTSTAASSTA